MAFHGQCSRLSLVHLRYGGSECRIECVSAERVSGGEWGSRRVDQFLEDSKWSLMLLVSRSDGLLELAQVSAPAPRQRCALVFYRLLSCCIFGKSD